VIAISVDGLNGELTAAAMASKKVIDQIGFPFESGLATARTVEKLQLVNDHLFDAHRSLPAPSSFLIDPRGKLAAIYKGKMSVDQLLADLQRVKSGSSSQLSVFPGRWLNQSKAQNPFRLVWKMLEKGFLEESCEYIQRNDALLAQHLEYPNLLVLAGNGQLSRGQAQQAAELYRKALKITPDYVDAQNNLAWLLATHSNDQIRNGIEALRLAEAVVKKQGQIPSYLDTLAAAYAEVGRFPDAVVTAKKAVQIASSQGDKQMTQAIQSRFPNYQSAKPWRDK
jgi:tetratricopeptide (TPR) repeat protein